MTCRVCGDPTENGICAECRHRHEQELRAFLFRLSQDIAGYYLDRMKLEYIQDPAEFRRVRLGTWPWPEEKEPCAT